MPGRFGRDHEYVDVRRRHYLLEVYIEPVRESERLARFEVGQYVLTVYLRLLLVGREYHYYVRLLRRFRRGENGQTRGFRALRRLRPVIQSDDDVHAAVFKVERVRMPLTAVAYDSYRLLFEMIEIAILAVEYLCHSRTLRFMMLIFYSALRSMSIV